LWKSHTINIRKNISKTALMNNQGFGVAPNTTMQRINLMDLSGPGIDVKLKEKKRKDAQRCTLFWEKYEIRQKSFEFLPFGDVETSPLSNSKFSMILY